MPKSQPNLFTRHDTFFGVCEAIGQDFGFHPNFLRALFAVSVLASPKLVLATYAVLAVVVMIARWRFPAKRGAAAIETPVAEAPSNANDAAEVALARAA